MKRFFTRAAMLLAAAASAFTFTACDDDGDAKNPFKSELIGSYKPASVNMTIPGVVEKPSDFYFLLLPTWSDPDNIPLLGGFMPANTVIGLINVTASNLVKGGLAQIELKNDGTFGANYYDLVILMDEETGEPDILSSVMQPEFGTELKTFPNAETAELLPEGALGYYTKDSRFFFTISKEFLNQVGATSGLEGLTTLIDGMLEQYKLDIVSTDVHYAIPLKYSVKDGMTKLYVDRAMILPYRDVLNLLLGALGNETEVMGIKLGDIVNVLFDNTTELEIALPLNRI